MRKNNLFIKVLKFTLIVLTFELNKKNNSLFKRNFILKQLINYINPPIWRRLQTV